MQVANYNVIKNGNEWKLNEKEINIPIRNANNSSAYFQYEKITDENLINKFNEIKKSNGNYLELQSLIKSTAPITNWSTWSFWNGYDSFTGMNGFGYPESPINVPSTGLYYMWLYFAGNNVKNVYGCILVDNLEEEVALQGISLPATQKVEIGKTITLTPTFNPSTASNKIVTWSSSDESVATVSMQELLHLKK